MSSSDSLSALSGLPVLHDARVSSCSATSGEWRPPEIRAGALCADGSTIEERLATAYREGVTAGHNEGALRAQEMVRNACAAVRQAADAVHEMEAELLRQVQTDLAAVSCAIAQKIIAREIAASREIVPELVQSALAMLPSDRALVVRLSPDDLRLVEDAVAPDPDVSVRWIADATLDSGSFVVDSPQRLIDGRTDVALRVLYERLSGA
jgi:flagellar assembly protein FliH